jgi:hypothetical protein
MTTSAAKDPRSCVQKQQKKEIADPSGQPQDPKA